MIQEIDIKTFIRYSIKYPVIDVRSPKEYIHAHFPGSFNIPLFNNEERAEVGFLYRNKGQIEATLSGMKIAGGKISQIADKGLKTAKDNTLLIYCWRGGMRSQSMAWIFDKIGINVFMLSGGYKMFRKYLREYFTGSFNLLVIGGLTGSGKTEILIELERSGQQVINLEKLANHKGSVFGFLGQPPQTSNEQFENKLFLDLFKLNSLKTIWIEDESKNIGKNMIPAEFFLTMTKSPRIIIEIDLKLRIEKLAREYGNFASNDLVECINKISRRLGGLNTKEAIISLQNHKTAITAQIILQHYDKTYSHCLNRINPKILYYARSSVIDPIMNANLIKRVATENRLVIT